MKGHRYDIYEEVGCWPYTYNTAVAYPLSITWPIVIGLVSIVYSSELSPSISLLFL